MATTTPAGVRAHAKHGGATLRRRSDDTSSDHGGPLRAAARYVRRDPVVDDRHQRPARDHRRPGGGQSAYTWVVTASLLAMTATTPLWGKLSDLYSKKALVDIALVIYVLGSAAAGLSQNPARRSHAAWSRASASAARSPSPRSSWPR